MLKVGDIVSRAPETIDDLDKLPNARNKLQSCRVIYVHPAGRFHVVAFRTRGGEVRESFRGT